jgi:hypothetical protein
MRILTRFSIAPIPFVVCTLMAIALWFYASMREEYTAVFDVPLEIRLPAGRISENEITSSVRAQVQGAGWQLLNHVLSASVRCVVYVPEKLVAEDEALVTISRPMLAQGMQAPTGVTVQRIMSDSFLAKVGVIAEKRLPVLPALDVATREGFIVTNVQIAQPDSVSVRGSNTVLSRLHAWHTEPIRLRDVYEATTVRTGLSDTLAGVVQVPQMRVSVSVNVEQMAEMRFEDVPLQVAGAPTRNSYQLSPTRFSVLLRGGVGGVTRLAPENVMATIDYNDVIASENGIVRVRINVNAPTGMQVVSVVPAFVRCVRRTVGSKFLTYF